MCYDAGLSRTLSRIEGPKSMAKAGGPAARMSFEQWLERLREAGFAVEKADGAGAAGVMIGKHGCAAVLESSPGGEPRFAAKPGLETPQGIAYLIDRGYQKFWLQGERQFPALATELQGLHRFEQDLRAVMGMTALYNEALGTVSARHDYDRLEGREKPKKHQEF